MIADRGSDDRIGIEEDDTSCAIRQRAVKLLRHLRCYFNAGKTRPDDHDIPGDGGYLLQPVRPRQGHGRLHRSRNRHGQCRSTRAPASPARSARARASARV